MTTLLAHRWFVLPLLVPIEHLGDGHDRLRHLSRLSAKLSITDSTDINKRGSIHLGYYARQLDIWRQLKRTPAQTAEIDRLDALLEPITKLAGEGLVVAGDIKQRGHTFEGFMNKSDEQLGLDFLLGLLKG